MRVTRATVQPASHASRRSTLWRSLITVLVPLGFITFLLVYRLIDRGTYLLLIAEGGIFEDLTFLTYLTTAGLALLASAALRGVGERAFALVFLGVTAACLFIAGEEVSWAQRLLKIESPTFFKDHNHQQELNVHNFLGRYALHGAYLLLSGTLAFGWALAPRLLRLLPPRAQRYLGPRQWMLVPDRRLMLYFLPCLMLYLFYDYVNPIQVLLYGPEWDINTRDAERFFILGRDQEPIELLLGCGIMLFVGQTMRRARRLGRVG